MKKLATFFIVFMISFSGESRASLFPDLIAAAEADASLEGFKVLETSRKMIERKIIIRGACWDFIDEAYRRAGFPAARRETVFKSKINGPYARPYQMRPGDWLYLVNHDFNDSEHSGIFVAWTDKTKKEALLISYFGQNKNKPARFAKYNLRSVYNIVRPR